MDFISGLPKPGPQQHNANLVIVDPITTMAHYIPTHESITSEGTARLYFHNILKLDGLPDSLVSANGIHHLWFILGAVQIRSYYPEVVYKVPPTDRWSDKNGQCNLRTIPSGVY